MGLGWRRGQMLPKELFPVAAPDFDPVTIDSSHSSRRRRKVMSRKAAWQADCIHTLNELSGCGDAPPPKVQNSAQAGCLNQLRNTFDHQAFPGEEQAGEALLGLASSAYAVGPCQNGPTAPYAKANVAWPAPGSLPARLEQLLGEADRNLFMDRDLHMLRSSDVGQQLMKDSEICLHVDPVLKYNRQSFVEFLLS